MSYYIYHNIPYDINKYCKLYNMYVYVYIYVYYHVGNPPITKQGVLNK